MAPRFEVFVGYDPREREAYRVACMSLLARASLPVAVRPIWREDLEQLGIFTRKYYTRAGIEYDAISELPCSTQFSIARFAVPLIAECDFALFVDVDFLFRADVWELALLADERYAVQVVKHEHRPSEAMKMDGQVQRVYDRKNWSSCVLWNVKHSANKGAADRLNLWHRDALHRFEWLDPSLIGALPEAWNWLEGHSSERIEPKAVHYTRGTPAMAGYEGSAFANEWNHWRLA